MEDKTTNVFARGRHVVTREAVLRKRAVNPSHGGLWEARVHGLPHCGGNMDEATRRARARVTAPAASLGNNRRLFVTFCQNRAADRSPKPAPF